MSHVTFRPVLTLIVSLSALTFACASDQKTANTPEEVPPADGTSSQPGGDAVPPNGEPVGTPPSTPAPATTPQGSNDTSSGNSMATPGSPSSAQATPALTQAQVAKITELANTSEIEQAKLAQGKAKSASVRKFAAMMIKHHGEAKAQQAKLYQSLQITPTQSQSATQLKDAGDRALGQLRAANGSAFDREYMESQVDAHQKVLDTIDQQLLPAAVDQSLMDELKKMRATVESHLTEAKNVLDELDKTGAR